MTCRSCSATIDDKAIVCYRCGTPTADPATLQPRTQVRRGGGRWVVAMVFVTILIAVVYFYIRQP